MWGGSRTAVLRVRGNGSPSKIGALMAEMKAIWVEEFGEADVLQYVDVERPEPGESEVLIEVRSAGVNYADTLRRRNQYVERQDLPFTPGSEVAGTVAE